LLTLSALMAKRKLSYMSFKTIMLRYIELKCGQKYIHTMNLK
jgi:hypothetical protein